MPLETGTSMIYIECIFNDCEQFTFPDIVLSRYANDTILGLIKKIYCLVETNSVDTS